MPLVTGTSVGPYQIIAPLGVGGIGEVYRARDTKLNRDVALKVLPEIFTADPERVARFQREDQLLASLNHPNIGQIYGLEESDGTPALVLQIPAYQEYPSSGAAEPRPLPNSFRVSVTIRRVMYFTFLYPS
jgi:eukaryotic-like serine/threonine-protein kinase